jgi:hypothetical protein
MRFARATAKVETRIDARKVYVNIGNGMLQIGAVKEYGQRNRALYSQHKPEAVLPSWKHAAAPWLTSGTGKRWNSWQASGSTSSRAARTPRPTQAVEDHRKQHGC